jgi:polyhydroxyalkanoate synthesis repressor PhaR
MIAIKKYSNRRLYNTDSSSYITQDDIVDLIKKKISFQITDVDSKKDITSSILMQILLEKQTTGTNLVPEEFLKQIILFNENNQSADMFSFLSNVLNFANSNNIFTKGFDGMMKSNPFDFQKFFTYPFSNESYKEEKKEPVSAGSSDIDTLSKQLNELKSQLEGMKKKSSESSK